VQMCKMLCEHLDKDGVKDVESAVGVVRSDKVKKEREQAAKDKKGAQLLLRPLLPCELHVQQVLICKETVLHVGQSFCLMWIMDYLFHLLKI
jgi:hypothetical protein